MKPTVSIMMFLFVSAAGPAVAQESVVRAPVSYISGGTIYIASGRGAGIRDSSRAFLIAHGDTLAVLNITAISSTSSACVLLSSRRTPVVGDTVVVPIATPGAPPEAAGPPAAHADTVLVAVSPPTETPAVITHDSTATPFVSLRGRMGIRYLTILPSGSTPSMTQPSFTFSLRGKINNSPLQFTLFGNVRTLIYGSSSPFRPGGIDQSRLYRLSLDYDDATYKLSLGRLTTSFAAASGYTDGLLVARTIGDLVVGVSAGYEPSFSQQSFSTAYRKFTVFGGYQPEGNSRYAAGLSYGKTYYHTALDREVVSGSFTVFPVRDIYVYAQSEVDLRTKKNDQLTTKPKMTMLLATVDYRLSVALSLGMGVISSRPSYSYEAIRSVPDSLLDMKLRTSPTVSVHISLPAGLSVTSRYSPRTSDRAFGKEYAHYTTLGLSNLFGKGLSLRGGYTGNSSSSLRTDGVNVALEKTFPVIGDLTSRYQFYRYRYTALSETRTSKSVAMDLMTPLFRSITLWSSVERAIGLDADATTISLELSWNF